MLEGRAYARPFFLLVFFNEMIVDRVKMFPGIAVLVTALCWSHGLLAAAADDRYDPDAALEISQAAIGRLLGNHSFMDSDGNAVAIHDFAGKPLVISMVFSSCHHVCPTTTKHLDQAAQAAREVLGEDSFRIVTIGFDTARDTPDAMDAFAKAQGIDANGWHFLSATAETIETLSEDLGFIYFPSPRGFDHINQLTILDRNSTVYTQVYGVSFELPWLVEPLKDLIFNRPESVGHPWSSLVDRIRLFCTVYDPTTGRYEIDNSLFFRIAIGLMIVLSVSFYLWREFRRSRN
jgi:protein SCO1